ncbi:unnamed protein product [Clonostachys chloroleuca]|uniref:Azaphilone pigments biosynthesis cluster protein L N-terminal domain-containing protein n=1 Tax=Clonostachys chloroleuca TaxID=1926264 RepID=A0AA35QEQ8_9HYPO|nr:unnamed protein product [Clonostachys chloroleuca]
MADPLSVTASIVALVTAAIQSTKSLNAAVKRYMERDKTLRRLQTELDDLTKVLEAFNAVCNLESSVMSLLEGPVSRCSQLCRDFEATMNALGGYKSTISVGLGTITMQTSRLSHQVLEEYSEVIQDTAYNLNIHLERIDEKMGFFTEGNPKTSNANLDLDIDLQDEKTVTEQCLRICEDAGSYLESIMDQEPSLQPQTDPNYTISDTYGGFEAPLLTRKALNDHRDHFAEVIGRMNARLEILAMDNSPGSDGERLRLENDIEVSRQCLEGVFITTMNASYSTQLPRHGDSGPSTMVINSVKKLALLRQDLDGLEVKPPSLYLDAHGVAHDQVIYLQILVLPTGTLYIVDMKRLGTAALSATSGSSASPRSIHRVKVYP